MNSAEFRLPDPAKYQYPLMLNKINVFAIMVFMLPLAMVKFPWFFEAKSVYAVIQGGGLLLAVVYLIPLAILGVLLLYAGSQLCMTIIDLMSRKDLFVAVVMLGITLAANLAAAFLVGIALALALKSERMTV